LYFEIFQFNPSNKGNWKVSLIAEHTIPNNPMRLSQLRAAAKFLSTSFGWSMPKGATQELEGDSAAVFLTNWKFGQFPDRAANVDHAKARICEVLDHPEWDAVFAVK